MPTRRQIATSILSVYRRQQARVGYVLPANIVAAFSERGGWSVDETETAINYGCAEGWFEFSDVDERRFCRDAKRRARPRRIPRPLDVMFAG